MDPQQLDYKEKLVIYIGVFIEIYDWRNRKLAYETYEIVKLEKYLILRVESLLNLDVQQFYKIS